MTDQPVRNTEISLTLNPDAPKVPQLATKAKHGGKRKSSGKSRA